jgi:hypothetical protein
LKSFFAALENFFEFSLRDFLRIDPLLNVGVSFFLLLRDLFAFFFTVLQRMFAG